VLNRFLQEIDSDAEPEFSGPVLLFGRWPLDWDEGAQAAIDAGPGLFLLEDSNENRQVVCIAGDCVDVRGFAESWERLE
jgi:hypothetical protein